MKTVVLDIGGVCYAAPAPDEAWWARWAPACGVGPGELAHQFWHGPDVESANIGAISADDYYARAALRLGVAAGVVHAMVRELFVGEIDQAFIDVVRGLRRQGAPVSALTNSWSSAAELMARPELQGLFDLVISSADVGAAKPGEEIFRIAAQRLDVPAAELVFVDDDARNVATARSLGWRGIQFVTADQCAQELTEALA